MLHKDSKNFNVYDLDLDITNASGTNNQQSSFFVRIIDIITSYLKRKSQERLTVMYIPHNGKRIKNLHISQLTFGIIATIFFVAVFIGTIVIVQYTSNVQKINVLRTSQQNMQVEFKAIANEVNEIFDTHKLLKSYIDKLSSLTDSSSSVSFAVGGAFNPVSQSKEDQHKVDFSNLFEDNVLLESNLYEVPNEIFLLNATLYEMNALKEPLGNLEKFLDKRKDIIIATPKIFPVKGRIINSYGNIINSIFLYKEFNRGIDISAMPQDRVVVTAPGIVNSIQYDMYWGYIIKVQHKYGYLTIYQGIASPLVKENDKLEIGDSLGLAGGVQNAPEVFIRYKILVGTHIQDPRNYLYLIP